MARAKTGFHTMDKAALRAMASCGGKAAHANGHGRQWKTGDENSVLAGKKGGAVTAGKTRKPKDVHEPLGQQRRSGTTPLHGKPLDDNGAIAFKEKGRSGGIDEGPEDLG